jgi:hypothetical protein
MDGQVRTGFARASRLHKWTTTAAIALAVSGCVSPAFRTSVGQFGTVTKAAATAQNQRLAAVTANEEERIRSDLVRNRIVLRFDQTCSERLAAAAAEAAAPPAPAAPATPPSPEPECRLVPLHGDAPVEQAPRFEHIIALSGALSAYSDSLIALTADSTTDQKAFATSLSGLATSLGGLDAAIRAAVGEPAGQASAQFGEVAKLIAEAGNLYFAFERDRQLRNIIIKANPIVQHAVRLLSGADGDLTLNERTRLMRLLDDAEGQVSDAINHKASDAALRAAEDRLFQRLAAYNNHGANLQGFAAIGVAHDQLATAAAAHSTASLQSAIEAIGALVHLATTAQQTVTSLNQNTGSPSNGH